MSNSDATFWQQEAYQCLLEGNYDRAANLYEQAIANSPDISFYYWYLGLMLLLQGQEAEAQMTWLSAMSFGEPEEIETWTSELIGVLETEARRREDRSDDSVAWLIRDRIREINPDYINNLLHLVYLSIKLEKFTGEELNSWGVIEILRSEQLLILDNLLLMQVLRDVLDVEPLHPYSLELAEACIAHVSDPYRFIDILIFNSVKIAYSAGKPALAAKFMELALRLDANNPEVLIQLTGFYQDAGDYSKGIQTAKSCESLLPGLPEKVFANHLLLRGLMMASGEYWTEANSVFDRHETLLRSLFATPQTIVDPTTVVRLFSSTFFLPYLRDDLQKNRNLQNKVAQICQTNIKNNTPDLSLKSSGRSSNLKDRKKIKIGYLSHCLKRHSVGWITRWLIKYHDRDKFELNAYFINAKNRKDPLQEWYAQQVSKAYKSGLEAAEIVDRIYEDEIDILIDLDSITLDIICEITSLKPAPIQVAWLGWDASGIPAVDYFIADPYVLPESAQDYYSETVWRLPQTYVAVDGFEIGIPTLRREDLAIPNDAIVYFSSQMGFKRHPNTVRLQMKIMKEVPNSYFLIKGTADKEAIKSFFAQIAESEEVSIDRLRFLEEVPFEETHRANLGIADVVLDTYPYNGATTTLETLWMGIPLVTRVGEQFASRNSYTMMMNVGVTEGIAWTDEEYVEWGIRLGKDAALRQQIAWKLKASRQTSPLWNGKKFTREMEKAYEQMWLKYLESV